jgi:hypothetical protein
MADECADAVTQILRLIQVDISEIREQLTGLAGDGASRQPAVADARGTQAVMQDQLTQISIRLASHSLTLSDFAGLLEREADCGTGQHKSRSQAQTPLNLLGGVSR